MDILLHPVRMRIIQSLMGSVPRSPQGLSELLSDIPRTSIYRHTKILAEAGVIEVAKEQPVRGSVEKFYRIAAAGAEVSPEELQSMSKDDHLRSFFTFLTMIHQQFEDYLDQGSIDLARDGAGYRQAALHLNEKEMMAFAQELNSVVCKYIGNTPGSDRTERLFTTIVVPKKKQ
ncbi:helix-turn-helix domain-containing protein [Fictibacillus iocasae]|uniref:Helix-turn-helix domain-containing protein n=1 Tax=Fictibacillus iocasae TaxID=2715437 RepID=A0ABW2NPD4_9BACL